MGSMLSKLIVIGAFCALFIIFEINGSPTSAFSSAMVPSRTAAPALGSFQQENSCAECHSGTVNSGGGSIAISAPANYAPGQNITVTVTISQTNIALFGFVLTALNDQGQKTGDFAASGDARTQVVNGSGAFSGRQYIQHTFKGIVATTPGQDVWTFTWKAPAQNAGRVTFYCAGLAADANGSTTGDFNYTTSKAINSGSTPAPTPAPLGPFASASAASFDSTIPLPPSGIVAGFGNGVAANTAFATTLPLPTSLNGTDVLVTDANNQTRNAGLFFVSANQINYLVPAGSANGAATITVRRNGAAIAQGTANINSVSPGLFSANANGQGVAAAVILRRRGGVDTFEQVAMFNPGTGKLEAIPIDPGPASDQLFLLAFGTGFRNVAQSAVTVTIGGIPSQVLFAGPQGGFDGLDQANVVIPRNGLTGTVNVVLTANGKTANTVQISFK